MRSEPTPLYFNVDLDHRPFLTLDPPPAAEVVSSLPLGNVESLRIDQCEHKWKLLARCNDLDQTVYQGSLPLIVRSAHHHSAVHRLPLNTDALKPKPMRIVKTRYQRGVRYFRQVEYVTDPYALYQDALQEGALTWGEDLMIIREGHTELWSCSEDPDTEKQWESVLGRVSNPYFDSRDNGIPEGTCPRCFSRYVLALISGQVCLECYHERHFS